MSRVADATSLIINNVDHLFSAYEVRRKFDADSCFMLENAWAQLDSSAFRIRCAVVLSCTGKVPSRIMSASKDATKMKWVRRFRSMSDIVVVYGNESGEKAGEFACTSESA